MIKVIAITKQTIFLEKVGLFFQPAGIRVIAFALNPVQGRQLLLSLSYNVALIDLNWHDKEYPTAFERLVSPPDGPSLASRTIGMATFYSGHDVERLSRLGVHGYFVRTSSAASSLIIDSIQAVASGKYSFATAPSG